MRSVAGLFLLSLGLGLTSARDVIVPYATAQSGTNAPPRGRRESFLSQVGRAVVAQSDLGVVARVVHVTHFRETTIGRLRIERVLHGGPLRPGELLTVMAGDPHYFGGVGDSIAVFATRFGRTQHRAFSRILLNSSSGRQRLEVLEAVLEIERRDEETGFSRALALKNLFFDLLVDEAADIRMLAIRELDSLRTRRPDAFLRRDAARIDEADLMRILPPGTRVQLTRLLDGLRRLPDRNEDRIRFHRLAVDQAGSPAATVNRLLSAVNELRGDAVTILDSALRNGDPRVRELAAMQLGQLAEPVAVPALLRQLREESDIAVQNGILDALGQLRAAVAIPALVAAAERPDLRRAAILGLARIGSAVAIESLKDLHGRLSASADASDREALNLIDFVFSPRFREQEANLERLRKRTR